MKNISILCVIGIFISFFLLGGCAPKTVPLTHPATQPQVSQADREGLAGREDPSKRKEGGISEEELARTRERSKEKDGGGALRDAPAGSVFKDVLFDFDSYSIKSEEVAKLKVIGDWLKQHKDVRIGVEGHCDERGTAEYNLALGQKRAEAVKDYLVKSGVDGTRIKTISYGKEIPLDTGHVESAWAKNRRAHFKIEQKG
jgi:peptidoglycan-associated lipoprotein